MRLMIDSQPAKLGMITHNAQLNYKTTLPKVELQTDEIQVQLESTQPKITIDQKQCFSESGLKGILELSLENASKASGLMYESVGRIAEQGNALTDIHLGGNPIADQAYYNAYDQFQNEFNMVTMPRTRPDIKLIRGHVNINFKGGTVNKKFVPGELDLQYNPGKVEIYMLQERQFNMRFEKSKFDMKG